jgi:hypothetical protein
VKKGQGVIRNHRDRFLGPRPERDQVVSPKTVIRERPSGQKSAIDFRRADQPGSGFRVVAIALSEKPKIHPQARIMRV